MSVVRSVAANSEAALLSVEGLSVRFRTDAGTVRAVEGVTFDIAPAETVALVGESGCGKSVTALSILRLIPSPPGEIVSGSIRFDGEDLARADEARMRAVRGNDVAMIFQEPMTSLNPVYTIGEQIREAIVLHQRVARREASERTVEMLERVGIPAPARRAHEYPHQMSGGMRQRAMIAMALSCHPRLLIADEPTTALDVTIQAQILELLGSLQRDFRMSILLITHDLGIVAETAHRVAVMYAGRIVERADAVDLFRRPRHPYTVGLFRSIPRAGAEDEPLYPIAGMVPDALDFPPGCAFHPRCPYAMDRCRVDEPRLEDYGADGRAHPAACWFTAGHPTHDYLSNEPSPVPRSGEGATT